jgi:UDP-N-acetylmuramate dehydrogenase
MSAHSLKPYHTFATPHKARQLLHIHSLEQLKQTYIREQPHYILGAGSNVLFTQDYPGIVLHNTLQGKTVVKENTDFIWLKIAGGENWHQLVQFCVAHNYAGIENLALIPGTVGAAPIQNIGAYGVELKDVFVQLEAFNLQTGQVETFPSSECEFGYRQSVFKNKLKDQYLITQVTLKLTKHPQFNIQYDSLKQMLDRETTPLSLAAISNAVIKIRQSKLPDPGQLPNAGSFFKNPVIDRKIYQELTAAHPHMPSYPYNNAAVKIPAGWLIEQCGWKGRQWGNVGVYEHQALVLVNPNQATGAEIYQLAQKIQQDVYDRFGIALMPEVNIL